MDELRKKRYRDKINYVIDCLKVFPIEPKNELEKMGIFYFDFKHAVRVSPYNVAGADVTCDIHNLRIKILSENRRISPFHLESSSQEEEFEVHHPL